jgi:CheY-like chemotaxis protein
MKTSQPKILIADADPLVLDALVLMLELEGYAVRSCRNAGDALDLCLRCKPDIVLVDIDSPAMNGYALLRTRLTTATGAPMQRIAMTSRIAVSGDSARIAGFDRVLEKPVAWTNVLSLLGDESAADMPASEIRAAA